LALSNNNSLKTSAIMRRENTSFYLFGKYVILITLDLQIKRFDVTMINDKPSETRKIIVKV